MTETRFLEAPLVRQAEGELKDYIYTQYLSYNLKNWTDGTYIEKPQLEY
jgi:hypothetical protein